MKTICLLIFCILAILATGIYQGLHAEPPLPDSGAQLMTTQPAFIVVPVK